MTTRPETALSRTGAVMEAIRSKLAARLLVPGDRLPSIRKLATAMAVSPSTVVEAYDRLVAEGVIRARRGSGFSVIGAAAPLDLSGTVTRQDRAIDPLWVSRQALDAEANTARPGCGWLPSEWLPVAALKRATRRLARADAPILTDYGGARGLPALRHLLARRCGDEGIGISPDQILLTGSGTQAIDLVCRFLLRPGDTVLLDDPCYFNFQALMRAHAVNVVGIPMAPNGPDMARFAEAAEQHRPRLYVTNAAIHNPTGATLAPNTAHRLVSEAGRHDIVIVEDDIFADLEPEPSPRLASLDGLDRVIRIGSFSKTVSASVRCGYIAARSDWIEGLIDLQVATSFGGPSPMATELISGVLRNPAYRRHLDSLRARLSGARSDMAGRLGDLGIEPWLMPRGGFLLWCRLPEGINGAAVARRAVASGVVLAPGDVFSPTRTAGGFMRFNVSQMADPRVWSVLGQALGPSSERDRRHDDAARHIRL